MATNIEDFVYTVQESATLLKLSERSIRRYIKQGKLRAYRVAGERQLRIKGEDLLQLLEPVENSIGDNQAIADNLSEESDSLTIDKHLTTETYDTNVQQ